MKFCPKPRSSIICLVFGQNFSRYFFAYGFTGQMTDTDTFAAITDYAGDVVNFWNVTARALTGEVRTDAYGNQVMSGTVNSPYKYKSYYFDGESGLYYLNARYYA